MSSSVDILYITFNRLDYTKETLPALIENANYNFSLTIVDNGSDDGTVSWLKEFARKQRKIIKSIRFMDKNQGISKVTNDFWHSSNADFIGKVDNDTLLPLNWLKRLIESGEKSNRLGVIGGFHFNTSYVDMPSLEKRVMEIDGVQLIPDAFIGGCCYVFRRKIQRKIGYLNVGPLRTHGWTQYQENICRNGYINGYLYPLLLVRHFDDPMDSKNLAFTKHKNNSIISMGEKGISDHKSLLEFYKRDVNRVISGISLQRVLKEIV